MTDELRHVDRKTGTLDEGLSAVVQMIADDPEDDLALIVVMSAKGVSACLTTMENDRLVSVELRRLADWYESQAELDDEVEQAMAEPT